MFKRIKKWFNDPINEDDSFGVNIRKLYQFFRDWRRDGKILKEEESKSVFIPPKQINTKPYPFDDASFLVSLKMEIRSRIIFLASNAHLFTNAGVYVVKYENLIKVLDDLISVTELTEEEIKKLFDKSFLRKIEHEKDKIIDRMDTLHEKESTKLEVVSYDPSTLPPVPTMPIPRLSDKTIEGLPECKAEIGYIEPKYDSPAKDEPIPQKVIDGLNKLVNVLDKIVEKKSEESEPSIPPSINIPRVENVKEAGVPRDIASFDIPPHQNIPDDFVPIENQVTVRETGDSAEEVVIITEDHSCDTLGARELTNLLDANEPDDPIDMEDHNCETLGARELTNLSSDDEDEKFVPAPTDPGFGINTEKEEQIFQKLVEIINDLMTNDKTPGVDKLSIRRESNFVEDLGFDSLDVVEFVMTCEDEFEINIPDEDVEKITTVGPAVQYLLGCVK